MKKASTHCCSKSEIKKTTKKDYEIMPHQQTLDYLSQFARVYHADPVLNKSLNGMILN